MQQKTYLLISSNSSPRGGGERYLVYLTKGLYELGHKVHVLLSNSDYMDGWAMKIKDEGATVHRKNLKGLSQRPFRFIQALFDKFQINTITSFCNELMPNAILVNQQYDEDGLDYIKGALKSNIKSVSGIIHMPMTNDKHKRPLGKLRGKYLSYWYKHNPYKKIFVSTGSKLEFDNYYKTISPTRVVNNSIPVDNFIQKNNSQNKLPTVGFVGQFVEQKNLLCLVDAWLFAKKRGFNSKLLLVGDGPKRDIIESKLIESAPPDSWEITGWQNKPEQFLKKVNIFMMTSHFEGLPLSLIEAAGRGIPCVVAPFNGASDVRNFASWVKVAKNNSVHEIGMLLIELIDNKNKKNQILKSNLDEFKTHFSLRRMAIEISRVMDL